MPTLLKEASTLSAFKARLDKLDKASKDIN